MLNEMEIEVQPENRVWDLQEGLQHILKLRKGENAV